MLDVLERRAPRWVLVGIEATRPASGSPRYRLVDRQEGRDRRREVDSYAVFEQIIEAG